MVDRSLVEHWKRERAARSRLRDSLPPSWRHDSRPRMDDVRELYVEAMLALKRPPARSVAVVDDDPA